MKWIIGALLIVAGTTQLAFAAGDEPVGRLNPRFDGRWIGMETFMYNNASESWAGPAPQMKTMIVIADSGRSVGVVSKFAAGRYLISPKSKGNTIRFDSAFRRAKLTLSVDGNTIKEDGNAAIFVPHRGNVLTQVSATFHRSGNQK
jgi:hypothetical protein